MSLVAVFHHFLCFGIILHHFVSVLFFVLQHFVFHMFLCQISFLSQGDLFAFLCGGCVFLLVLGLFTFIFNLVLMTDFIAKMLIFFSMVLPVPGASCP